MVTFVVADGRCRVLQCGRARRALLEGAFGGRHRCSVRLHEQLGAAGAFRPSARCARGARERSRGGVRIGARCSALLCELRAAAVRERRGRGAREQRAGALAAAAGRRVAARPRPEYRLGRRAVLRAHAGHRRLRTRARRGRRWQRARGRRGRLTARRVPGGGAARGARGPHLQGLPDSVRAPQRAARIPHSTQVGARIHIDDISSVH